jgi:hypothetical protein
MPDFAFALPPPALALPFDLALPLEPALALPVEPLLLPLCDIEGFAELEEDEAFLSSAAYAPKARSEKLTIRVVTDFID